MALAAAYWRLAMTFTDKALKTATREFRLVPTDDAGDATDVLAAAATVVAAFQAASDCLIKAYQVEKVFLDSSITTPTAATALSSVVAQITGKIAGAPNESGIYDWPGPKDLVFLATSGPDADTINMAQSEVDTIADFFDAAGTNLLLISDGETLVRSTEAGNRVTNKRNRRKK